MKTVNCDIVIGTLLECPNEECGSFINLFEMESLTDEGYIYRELLSNERGWGKENWGKIVKCPECGEIFKVGDVTW